MYISLKNRESLIFLAFNHQLIVYSIEESIKIFKDDVLSEYFIINYTLNEK